MTEWCVYTYFAPINQCQFTVSRPIDKQEYNSYNKLYMHCCKSTRICDLTLQYLIPISFGFRRIWFDSVLVQRSSKEREEEEKEEKRKILRSQRKLVSRSNLLWQIQKSWSQILKILKRKWRRRKRRKNERYSEQFEIWYT